MKFQNHKPKKSKVRVFIQFLKRIFKTQRFLFCFVWIFFILILVSLCWGVYHYCEHYDVFVIKKIRMIGDYKFTDLSFMDSLNKHIGQDVLEFPLEKYEKQIQQQPWVKNIRLKRGLYQIEVYLEEKKPIFLSYKLDKRQKKWFAITDEYELISIKNILGFNLPVIENFFSVKKRIAYQLLAFLDLLKNKQNHIYQDLSQIKYVDDDEFLIWLNTYRTQFLISISRNFEDLSLTWSKMLPKISTDSLYLLDLRINNYTYLRPLKN